ncbi:methyltransferase domain protein [Asticcacaulis biprosthecium C19]|uniref:Methyltransferase domain protein n=1 Tax=Asticcacaulis biprosthecium C19 TaxID=715226 RepID=F4QSB5_9CAUL|nr:class I SAM-dependent methyltransferase [Asticcacaulis biprosthecium]EGF89635.1 methyltransferase domain protein [Asticcacaulis biprosthecium C19]
MSAADAIIELYDRRALDWDADRGRDLFERPWLDRFAALLAVGGTVLDSGCGSGDPIARHFLESGYNLTGVDSGGNMIAICREKFPDADWTVSDMRDLNLDRAFDGMLAWHSLFHLTPDDQRKMFPVFRKHARSGTALMFTSGSDHNEIVGQWHEEPLYHGSLSQDEYRTLLGANGFDIVHHIISDPACGSATVWLARAR